MRCRVRGWPAAGLGTRRGACLHFSRPPLPPSPDCARLAPCPSPSLAARLVAAGLGPDAVQAILESYPTPMHLYRKYQARACAVWAYATHAQSCAVALAPRLRTSRCPRAQQNHLSMPPQEVHDAALRRGECGHRAAEKLLHGLKAR